ncbi:MAG: hypothetical protein BWY56_02620 [Acidobacteria bacterium ADurb.Bin340]|nr:MAG: hypothetical protein BWY56_02620 [Acidobacteria bacterium ADurb.Bin340]
MLPGHGRAGLGTEGGHVLGLQVPGEAQDLEAAPPEPLPGAVHAGQLGAAGGAPGGPEVQQQVAPLEGVQGVGLPRVLQVLHREGRRRGAHAGLGLGVPEAAGEGGVGGAGVLLLQAEEGGLGDRLVLPEGGLELGHQEARAHGGVGVTLPARRGEGLRLGGIGEAGLQEARQQARLQGPGGRRGGKLALQQGHERRVRVLSLEQQGLVWIGEIKGQNAAFAVDSITRSSSPPTRFGHGKVQNGPPWVSLVRMPRVGL